MNNLVPEQRTDRTGRTQTRWVKPEADGRFASGIPAPSVADQRVDERMAASASVLAAMRDWGREAGLDDVEERAESVADVLPRLSGGTVLALDAALHDEATRPLAFDLMADECWKDDEELRSTLAYLSEFSILTEASEAVSIVMGLKAHGLVRGAKGLYELEGRDREAAAALCKVTAAVSDIWFALKGQRPLTNRVTEKHTHLADPELVALIRRHPERAEDICNFIVQRSSTDPKAIAAFLTSHSALAEGSL